MLMPYRVWHEETMHIEEALLDRVIREYGFSSKTEAVEASLREMDRRSRLRAFGERGLGLSADELREAVDPDYDLEALRVAETPRRAAKRK
jgi:Arc/MetJ family transcription regulator